MNMQPQQQSRWCWAAVAASLHNFLDAGAAAWNQSDVATPVLQTEGRINAAVDCSLTPGLCNIAAALDDALKVTGNLRANGFRRNQHLVFENIKTWVNAQLPVGARVVWWGGGAHFIVIDGFREFQSGLQQVHVEDPLYGPSFQDYDDLVSGYGLGGDWQDTYLVKKSTGGG